MSLSALLVGVRDSLRTALATPYSPAFVAEEILIMPSGQPAPYAGQKFIAVHANSWLPGSNDSNRALDEVFGVSCTLTLRSPYAPIDRRGDELYTKLSSGMEEICRKIITVIHMQVNPSITLPNASSYMVGQAGMMEYLRWQSCDAVPREVGPDWFYSEADNPNLCGLVMEVRFGGARRAQDLT